MLRTVDPAALYNEVKDHASEPHAVGDCSLVPNTRYNELLASFAVVVHEAEAAYTVLLDEHELRRLALHCLDIADSIRSVARDRTNSSSR